VVSARSSSLPTLSLSTSWTHNFSPSKIEESSTDIPGVGTVTIPEQFVQASDPVTVDVDLSQNLLTFGRIRQGVRLAEEGVDRAQLELDEEERALIVAIRRAFWGYVLAREVVVVHRETLRQKEEALDVARKRFAAGLTPDYEVLSAESDLEGFRPTVISAENEVRYALLAVKDLLNLSEEGDDDVELVGTLEPDYRAFDRDSLVRESLARNYDIRQYQSNLQLAEHQLTLSRREKNPAISGFASYSLQSGFDSSTGENLYTGPGAWEDELTVGIAVSMELTSLFGWSRVGAESRKAELDLEALRVTRSEVEGSVRLAIENILLKLKEERAKIVSSQKAVELAERLYDSARTRYEQGLVANTELRSAQIDLNNARLGYFTSVFNYKSALFDLADAVGVDHF
jgi:outer membrane protein